MSRIVPNQSRRSIVQEIVRANRAAATMTIEALESRILFTWIGATGGTTNDLAHQYDYAPNWSSGAVEDSFSGATFSANTTLYLANNRTTVAAGLNFNYSGNYDLTIKSTSATAKVLTLAGDITGTYGGTNVIIGDATNAINIALSGSTRTATVAAGQNLTILNIVSGAFGLTKAGTGALTLAGVNTYSGTTTLSAGQINLNSTKPIGTGTFAINGGSIDNTSGGALINAGNNVQTWGTDFSFGGSNAFNMGTGTVALTASRSISVGGTTVLTEGGIISGAFGLSKTGSGILALGGTNTFSGTMTLSAGQLNINNTKATGSGTFVIAGGAIDAATGAITLANVIPQTWSGDFTFVGTNALTLGTGAVTLSGNRTITSSASALTVAGIVGDAGFAFAINKAGSGALTLSGANTFTGGTKLLAGQLNLNNASSLGTGTFEIDGGTIDNSSAAAITLSTNNVQIWSGDFTFIGTKSLNFGTGAVTLTGNRNVAVTTAASTLTVGGAVSDGVSTYSLTKSGAGILALAASDGYDGGTTISAGTLNFVSGALGSGSIAFGNGGALQWATGNTQDVSANVAPLGSSVLASFDMGSNTVVFATSIGGQGSFSKAGAGTLTLSTANSLSGGVTLTLGILNINDAGALGSGTFTINGGTINNSSAANLVLSTNNAITVGASFTFTGTKSLDLGTGAVTLTGARTITTTANTLVFGGVVSGAFVLSKAGSGLLTLSNANTYSGGTSISAGTININNAAAIGTGTLTFAGGGINNTSGSAITLSTNNPIALNNTLTFTGTSSLNLGTGAVTLSAARSIAPAASTLTIGGVISGAFALTKSGNGILALTNANTYASTTLTTGTLAINNANAIGTGGFTITGGTIDNTSGSPITLATNNAQTWGGTVTIANGNNINLGTGAITMTAARQITVTAGTYTIAGVISGAFVMTKAGAGTLIPTAANAYSGGTVLNGGTLALTDSSVIGNGALSLTSGTLDNTSGSAMTLTNNINLSGNFTFAGSNNLTLNTGTVTLTGNRQITTTAGTLSIAGNISGSFSLTKLGAGRLALSGNNTYTNGTALSAGELDINSATAIGTGTLTLTAGTFDNTSGGAITLSTNNAQSWAGNVTFAGSNNLTFGTGNITLTASRTLTVTAGTLTQNGFIGGAFALTKAGAGTLTLVGASTYTAGTTISGGTLYANNTSGSATGTGAVAVSNGATLAGTGKASGPVTVNSGGTLSPGANSTAIFNTGNLILNAGSNLNITLNGDVAGTDYDQVNVTGTVSIPAGVLNMSGSRSDHTSAYLTIIANDVADAVTGAFSGRPQTSTSTYNGVDYTISYLGGTGNDVVLGANLAATTTTIDPGGTTTVYGQPVTFTAHVADAASGSPTGSVTFLDGATVLGSGVLDAFGTATITTTGLAVGNRSVTAVYGGDANFAGSSSSTTADETVNQASSSTAIQSSAANSKVGEQITFTATVTAISPGSGLATGNITFFDGATSLGTSALDNTGVATLDVTSLAAGSHSITTIYVGDTNFIASSSSAITQSVQQSTTTLALVTSNGPTVSGETVSFAATIAVDAPGGGIPTGSVQFKDGATILGTASLDSTGVASFDATALGAGTHSISAVYVGTADYATSTSNAISQSVSQATTNTWIASSVNPSVFGQSTTFTATVSIDAPGSGTATGAITFMDGATTIGTASLNSSGQASLIIGTLIAGTHSITAAYAGDANYVASASSTLNQTVNQAATSTTLSSTAAPAVFGQSVTFTASTVATVPGGGVPSGTITFKDGATTLGTSALDGSGNATLSMSSLTVANHSITAIYGGSTNHSASTSSAFSQQVNPAATSGVLTSSATPSVFGQSVTFTVAVAPISPGAGTPSGTVDFMDGPTVLGTVTIDGTGHAIFSTSALSVASHSMSAVYSGDSHFTGNTSTKTQVVNKSSTTSSISSSANPSVHGQSVTITATIVATAPGSGVPTGTVTFNYGSYVLSTSTLDGTGHATYTNTAAGVGTYPITINYAGDINYQASVSSTLNQVVTAASTATSLASSVSPSVIGQSVRFTATVAVSAPGSGSATGAVTFKDGSTTIGSGTLDGSGIATLDVASLVTGSHNITATYGGDASDSASVSSTLSQTVNTTATTTSLSSSATPSVFGEDVTFTAHVGVTSPGTGSPSGIVTFKDGSTTLGSGTLNASGDANFDLSTLTVGSHSITAIYAGDSSFATSSTSTLTQTVNSALTATTLSSSHAPSVFGQSTTLTATVTTALPGNGTPVGMITFKDGSTTVGTATLDGSGVATLDKADFAVGSHSITAVYSGNSSFATSTSSTFTQPVNQASTTSTVSTSVNPTVFGQSTTFTAHIAADAPGAGLPTGTVAFKDGSTTLGTGTLDASGDTTYSTAALAIGSHSITVVYVGDTNFSTSMAATLTQIVQPAATATTISSSANPSTHGQSVTFTATVTTTSPGSGMASGNVTFKDGSSVLGVAVLDASGLAIFTTGTSSVGSHTITASYAGNTSFTASVSSSLTQVVEQSGTTTALVSSLSPSIFGQSIRFTATVSDNAPGMGTPTGTITFKDGATVLGSGTLDGSGIATFDTASLEVGSHNISAIFGGDTDDVGSTSATVTQTVGVATTSTSVTSSAAASVFGQDVIFTAHVGVNSPGVGTPSGTVTFKDGSTTVGTGTLNSSGDATFDVSTLAVGSHSITALYAGDSSFATSTSTTLTQTIQKAATTTWVGSSTNPSAHGQSVTFTASVSTTSPGNGTPAGSVTFKDGTTVLGVVALDASGLATFTAASLTVNSHSITVIYAGNASYIGSTSASLTQMVQQTTTSTTLTSSVSPSVFGQSTRFIATVGPTSPGSGTPTGTITFKDGLTTIGSCTLNASGIATLDIASLSAGNHNITAIFGGDTDDVASTSATVLQIVNVAPTTTSISSSAAPSVFGQTITLTGHVNVTSPGAGTPSGIITFNDGSTTLGTAAVNASGDATFDIASLAFGSHSITATYAGDSSFDPSASASLTQTVNQAATWTGIASSHAPSVFGQSTTFTATVIATSPGHGTPTGTVTFKDGSTVLGTSTLDGTGTAAFDIDSLDVGTHSITAVYSASTNFVASSSSTRTQVVNQSSTTSTISSSVNPTVFGQSTTFSTHIASALPGAGVPSGSVTFKDGTAVLGTGMLDASGDATLNIASLSVASHSITVVYGGDTQFATSTSSAFTQSIQKASTATSITSSANPSIHGQSVTYTATVATTSPGNGTPVGNALFKDGATVLGVVALDSSGSATFSTTDLSVGSHSITAVYAGNQDFALSVSSSTSQSVAQATTSISLNTSATPAALGDDVTFTATVSVDSPGAGIPTGTVAFHDGSTLLGSDTIDSSGVATFTAHGLAVGDHTISADYAGDASFAAATTASLTQHVDQGTTTLAVSLSKNSTAFGEQLTISAQLGNSSLGVPGGQVTFLDGTTVLGSGTIDNTGAASLQVADLSVGTHSIHVAYPGDANVVASDSAPAALSVNRAETNVSLISSANPGTPGQHAVFTAVLTVRSPGLGMPTGAITFYDGLNAIGIGTLDSSGIATLDSAALTSGTHTITAVYVGNGNFAGDTSAVITQSIADGNAGPTIARAAQASPLTSNGTTSTLSTLGGDDGGESNLKYFWAVIDQPHNASPRFSDNASNAAKITTVTFDRAGRYTFAVTVTDSQGLSATSMVRVNVTQILTAVRISPKSSRISIGASFQFQAAAFDQFDRKMESVSSTAWSVSDGRGTVDDRGLFTSSDASGQSTISATISEVSANTSIDVAALGSTPMSAPALDLHAAFGRAYESNLSLLLQENGLHLVDPDRTSINASTLDEFREINSIAYETAAASDSEKQAKPSAEDVIILSGTDSATTQPTADAGEPASDDPTDPPKAKTGSPDSAPTPVKTAMPDTGPIMLLTEPAAPARPSRAKVSAALAAGMVLLTQTAGAFFGETRSGEMKRLIGEEDRDSTPLDSVMSSRKQTARRRVGPRGQ